MMNHVIQPENGGTNDALLLYIWIVKTIIYYHVIFNHQISLLYFNLYQANTSMVSKHSTWGFGCPSNWIYSETLTSQLEWYKVLTVHAVWQLFMSVIRFVQLTCSEEEEC